MILPSANWRRTSWTTTAAVRPTARMARAENRKATDPPISIPMKTLGSATLIWVGVARNSGVPSSTRPVASFRLISEPIVSM